MSHRAATASAGELLFGNNVVGIGVAGIVLLNLLIDAATAVDAVVNALLRSAVGRSLDSRTVAGSSWAAA
ncbi:hypothetical protein AB0L13_42450 [Saccharopolyspora shandongensis]|uniref:hypothetical protein n=1 Tax=Saccharopolyspora shandongensis TaxID=418495 RepID=UPI0034139EAB